MTDVSKIQGPTGSPDPGKKEMSGADAQKFHDAMRKRVQKVSEVDPDEQKKRKRSEEAEEEQTLPEAETSASNEQITPFSLEQETKKISPFEMQKGEATIAPLHSASEKLAPFQAPSTEEMSDDSALLEGESFGATAKPPGQEAPTQTPPQTAPTVGQSQPSEQKPTVTAPGKKSVQLSEHGPAMAPIPSSVKPKPAAVVKKPPEEGLTAAELEEPQPSKEEDTSGFFEQAKKMEEKGIKTTKSGNEAAIQGAGGALPPSNFEQIAEEEGITQAEEKENNSSMQSLQPSEDTSQIQVTPSTTFTLQPLPPYAHMPPQVQEIFDRMVGVMTVMNMSGMTETTITLNAPQFASSVFFGTQIIIQEFSTAPQAFNIQLNGSAQAVALFQGNAQNLMAAFQAGNYNFRINRIETGYLAERPLFKRKESVSGENQDQTGDRT